MTTRMVSNQFQAFVEKARSQRTKRSVKQFCPQARPPRTSLERIAFINKVSHTSQEWWKPGTPCPVDRLLQERANAPSRQDAQGQLDEEDDAIKDRCDREADLDLVPGVVRLRVGP